MSNKSIVYSDKDGFHEIDAVPEFAYLLNESDDDRITRLGCSEIASAGEETGIYTQYRVYRTESAAFPFLLEIHNVCSGYEILCRTTADMLSLRAHLSSVILAEYDLKAQAVSLIDSLVCRDDKGALRLKRDETIQILKMVFDELHA